MKNKIILPLLLLLFLWGCKVEKDLNMGASMREVTYSYTAFQIDSMCTCDTLPETLGRWGVHTFPDYETGKSITRYVYYKPDRVYTVTLKNDGKFKVQIRRISR